MTTLTVRNVLDHVDHISTALSEQLDTLDPANDGPGLTPADTHVALATLAAEVGNLSAAFGSLINELDRRLGRDGVDGD